MLARTLPRYHAARNRLAAFCQGELNEKLLRERGSKKVLFAATPRRAYNAVIHWN
jgi:hypothetical protein